jgi:DNA polymerase III epsilon subunit-like protein
VVTQTTPHELHKATDWLKRLRDRGFQFPDSYIVFDTETTGLKVAFDYIVQIGHLSVENRIPRQPVETVLDWTRCDRASHGDIRQRLYETEDDLRKQGRAYKFSYDRIAAEGVDPVAVLEIYHSLFKQHQDAGCYFLTHNGVRYDTQIVKHHFRRFLNMDFEFDNAKMIDTGLMEKAQQLGLLIHEGESLPSFYDRVSKEWGKGVYWSLDKHCIPKYKLDEKHGLDIKNAHHAGFDCLVTHLLLEEFRERSVNY